MGRLEVALAKRIIEIAKQMMVKIDGPSFVKPIVCFKPMAQAVSKSPATMSKVHG